MPVRACFSRSGVAVSMFGLFDVKVVELEMLLVTEVLSNELSGCTCCVIGTVTELLANATR